MKVKTKIRAGDVGETGTGAAQQGNHNQTLVRDRKSLRVKSGIKAGEDGTYQAQAGGS